MPASAESARPMEVWPRVEGMPGPDPHPRRQPGARIALATLSVLCAASALAIHLQNSESRVLIIAGLNDRAMIPLLIAGATFALSLSVVMTAWHLSSRNVWSRVLLRTFGTVVMIAGTVFSLLALLVFGLSASITQYDHLGIPGSDNDLLVSRTDGLGDASVRLYRGGPWVYTAVGGTSGYSSTDEVFGTNGSVRLERVGGDLYVVLTLADDTEERIRVP